MLPDPTRFCWSCWRAVRSCPHCCISVCRAIPSPEPPSWWGGPPGPRPTPPSACWHIAGCRYRWSGSGTRASRADQGVRPTICAEWSPGSNSVALGQECRRHSPSPTGRPQPSIVVDGDAADGREREVKRHQVHVVGNRAVHEPTAGEEGAVGGKVVTVLPGGLLQVERVDGGIAEVEQIAAPLGPRKPTIWPFSTSNEMSSTATVRAYRLVRPSTLIRSEERRVGKECRSR